MSYRDPYSDQYGQQQPQYGGAANEFNPYTTTQQTHPTYDQSGTGYDQGYNLHYGDDAYANPRNAPLRQATIRSFLTGDDSRTQPNYSSKEVPPLPGASRKESDNTSGFDHGEFAVAPAKHSNFKSYRSSYRESLWTKGGRGKCVGRFCCCGFMTIVYLLVSVFLALLLWVRPPAISIQDAGAMPGEQLVQPTNDGINVNLGVNISVVNPNYFSLNFREIKAEIFYPINNTAIGGGTSKKIIFESESTKNFTFPFAINYKNSLDPRGLILADLLVKCGGTKSDITVDYKLTLGITILMIPITPVISDSFKFRCPLDVKDLGGLAGVPTGGS